ncbi:Phytosulfokin receptor 1 [Hibiscus syriacus]|uniref:Phytosulfokin receptor 1 n=1 Tax=Hibiscus syriacus TaxID=106335 RepID=A0A6A3BSC9_HIBSY|nr:Phytosulfokin receptor 1 [Hibiscus syriacus]
MNPDPPKDIVVDVDDDQKINVDGPATPDDRPGVEFSDVQIDTNSCGKEKEDCNSDPEVNKINDSNAKQEDGSNGYSNYIPTIKAQVQFPKPQPPPEQPKVERTQSPSLSESMPSLGKYIRDRSNTFSAAIMKRLSSLKEDGEAFVVKNDSLDFEVMDVQIPGIKVIVKLKSEDDRLDLKGRITFFSRSNCRDCTAVRKFFKEKRLPYVEINIDVFPKRAKELVERTGKSEVPQIFFNEKLLGGLVTLNSLRNSGELEKRMKELLSQKSPHSAPKIPVYGFDDDEEEEEEKDDLLGIVKMLRQSLPIQDRLIKMKIVKNCFAGDDMLEAIIHHLDCGRRKGLETAKQIARKHFIKHVFGESDFEDGRHFYRFLEHEQFITACFNFRTAINDSEPKSPSFLADGLAKLMSAILEAYASDDRRHVDYYRIGKSEEFRRYLNLTRDLQRVNLQLLTPDEKLAFFLNLYNAMVIHAVVTIGHPEGLLDRRAFFNDFQYVIGGYPYSLNIIQNGILRNNRKSPYSLVKPFGNGDRRLQFAPDKVNPLIHFGLCNGTRSSPTVRFFTAQGVEGELRSAAREYFQNGAIEINLDRRIVSLTRIIKWFSADFGAEKDVVKWVMNYVDATKAGLLMHLSADGGPVNIVYQDYDWSGEKRIVDHLCAWGNDAASEVLTEARLLLVENYFQTPS